MTIGEPVPQVYLGWLNQREVSDPIEDRQDALRKSANRAHAFYLSNSAHVGQYTSLPHAKNEGLRGGVDVLHGGVFVLKGLSPLLIIGAVQNGCAAL